MPRAGARLVPALVAMALVLGACTHGTDRTAPVPRAKAVLRLAVTTPSTLDPAKARTLDEQLVADQLFDSLTAWDPKTLAAGPAIAASWTPTPDQLHWDFTLRPD